MVWEMFPVAEEPGGFALLDETGWHSLLIVAAGPSNVSRVPKAEAGNDQDIIDDSIDEYLADVPLPPRPRGFDWYLKLPGTLSLSDVNSMLNVAVRDHASIAPRPDELLQLFHEVVGRLYSR
jgi:Family of unknown function (DUF5956)